MNIRNLTIPLIAPVLALMLFVGLYPNTAFALTLSPARIEINSDPGTVINRPITLFNDSKTTSQTFYVSFANFESQGETGSPRFVEPKSDLGTWMSTGTDSVTIPPNGSKDIILNINIPKDAYAGGHFAVVFFGTNPPKDVGNVSVGAKTGTLVLLSINGDVLEAGGLAGFNTKDHKIFYNSLPVSFQYRFKNDGNDRVKPAGNIIIHDAIYFPTEHINANAVQGNILPHSTRLFDVDWIKQPADKNALPPVGFIASFVERAVFQWNNFAVGPYIGTLDLIYGTQNIHTTKSVFFFVFPWQLLICLLIVFIVVFFIGRKLLRRYNRYIIKKAHAGMKSPHDVNHE